MNRSAKPYIYAAVGMVVVTGIGFLVASSDKNPEPVEFEEAEDVLNKAIIGAVQAIDHPQEAATQTATQTAAQVGPEPPPENPVEPTSPEPPRREDEVMADPGPEWVASAPEAPAEDAGAPADEPLGSLDREVIRDGIKSMRPIVAACYEQTLADFPDAEGRVTLAFTIAAENDEGRIELAELDEEKSTLIDSMLHDCMIKGLGDLKFPAPEGNGKVNVRYPFNFTAK